MLYKIKVGKETLSVMANSQASAEAWVAKKHGKAAEAVIAPEYPEVEVTATPIEEIEVVEEELIPNTSLDELEEEWELEEDEEEEDETDSSDS
jgi:hypothetical protein